MARGSALTQIWVQFTLILSFLLLMSASTPTPAQQPLVDDLPDRGAHGPADSAASPSPARAVRVDDAEVRPID